MEHVKKREEISKEFTWALEDLYQDQAAWSEDLEKIRKLAQKLYSCKGTLVEGAENLKKALNFYSELNQRFEKAYVYANQLLHQDMANGESQKCSGQVQVLMNQVNEVSAFLEPEILKIPDEKLTEYLADEPFSEYRRFLEEILRTKEHSLSEEKEELLARVSELGRAPSNIYGMFNNADITFQPVKDENGNNTKERNPEFPNNYIKHIKECVENYYIKQDVLESIEGIKNPVCLLSEAENNNQGILTIIELIDERIRHIDEAIEKLEKYQENFITKCFEKAETIVRDLEKLPGLSKIKFGGKDINIIKLELFEYEKDEKIRRMKEYIYKIVQDMEEKPEEMTKEVLNEKLSSKMLVGQIINIDKAYVKLYKIEDVQEHSTYKRWEEDLGSDGQVNAIYFMFAVCIISYISMLTRKDGSSKCKKVIIVDNPFGATSAVFLWKVMFEILKENNVQLIAPGHNISKEIISMFEVNYVLKHEFKDGNKKTVVVEQEFRTEDSLKNMNFDTIDGNQQKLF